MVSRILFALTFKLAVNSGSNMRLLLVIFLSVGLVAGQDIQPAASSADVQALTAQVVKLQKLVAEQNALLQQVANPPKPRHRKIVKVLMVVDHIGSVASIASVFGWVK